MLEKGLDVVSVEMDDGKVIVGERGFRTPGEVRDLIGIVDGSRDIARELFDGLVEA